MKSAKRYLLAVYIFILLFCLAGCTNEGKSAYELAVEEGFTGTLSEWLDSLNGCDSPNFTLEDIYESALAAGFEGTYLDFLTGYASNVSNDLMITNKLLLSVVSIQCNFIGTFITYGPWGNPYQTTKEYSSAGSGVIFSVDKEEGNAYIITNYHVVYDANSNTDDKICDDINLYLYAMEYTNMEISAYYIGGSMNYDIAVLEVNGSDILKKSNARAVSFANSDEIIVGEKVYAVGNPNALGLSITGGIVSVDSEYISMIASDNKTNITQRLIRIDAAVNGGNSGGGLFNSAGLLLGIVNAKIVDESIENIGYSIPSNVVNYLVNNIIDNYKKTSSKTTEKCTLGITIQIGSSKTVIDPVSNAIVIVQKSSIVGIENSSICKGLLEIDDILNSITINNVTYELTRDFMLSDLLLLCRKGDKISLNVNRELTNFDVEIELTNTSIII